MSTPFAAALFIVLLTVALFMPEIITAWRKWKHRDTDEQFTGVPVPLLRAPFTDEQVAKLREWQACDWVHPFTCCDHVTMNVEREGFICPKCGLVQKWAHEFMAKGAPPHPFSKKYEILTHIQKR